MMIRTFGLPSVPLSARSWVAVTWPYRLTVLLSVDIEMEVRAQMERTLIRPAPGSAWVARRPTPWSNGRSYHRGLRDRRRARV